MKKILFSFSLFAVILSLSACNDSSSSKNTTTDDSTTMNTSMTQSGEAEKLHTNMRKLWEDHVTWTRNVIFCLVDNLPGADQAVKRLLQNQDDIGNAVSSFYGDDAGKKLAALLHDHITISADVVKPAKKK
jgi:hypothetical protein